jgi:hypothetical protein
LRRIERGHRDIGLNLYLNREVGTQSSSRCGSKSPV